MELKDVKQRMMAAMKAGRTVEKEALRTAIGEITTVAARENRDATAADVETVVRTARKITHYGRYGRLSFEGGVNTGKGVGEVSGSPLVVDLGDNS